MKTISIVVDEVLLNKIISNGKKNGRKLSQEVRYNLERSYTHTEANNASQNHMGIK